MDLTRWLLHRRSRRSHGSPSAWTASTTATASDRPLPLPPLSKTKDSGQGVRLFRHMLGALASLLVVVIVYLYAAAGRIDFTVAHVFTALAVAGVSIFTICIATGFNRRFADPSLTGAQMMTSGLALAYLAYAASAFRPLQLPFYMVALLFGAFRLSIRQQLAISAYFVASFAVAIALSSDGLLHAPPAAAGHAAPPSGWLLAVHLALLLVVMSLIGGYVNSVRVRLRSTNSALQQALEKIERIATYDELTGLYNRRIIHQMAAKEAKRSQRNGSSLCVAMADADHFKGFNDRYGHAAGDEVLRMLSRSLRGTLRETEYVGRYGGEEFLIVLPETAPERAGTPLERLRQGIASTAIEGLPDDVRVTVSIGVTEYRRGEDIHAAIKRADTALYRAKHEGRNRIEWDL